MFQFLKIRRFRISQQIMIVFFAGVILPLCVTAFVVTNVNQHAVREELHYSAVITTDSVYQRLEKTLEEKELALLYVAKSMQYITPKSKASRFLKEIMGFSDETLRIDIVQQDGNITSKSKSSLFKDSDVEVFQNPKHNEIVMYVKLNKNEYLRKFVDINKLKRDIFKYLINEKRQVYIIDSKNNIVMSYNQDLALFNKLIPMFPKHYKPSEPLVFGKNKNEPNIFLKIDKPDWAIVVATPKQLTHYGIIDARLKIILAIVVAAVFIIVFGLFYSYSLNTNLTLLFKAIAAIGKGNYRRKVRLVKDFFTPSDIVFLMEKFNEMAQKVDEGYMELQKANEQLSKLDTMKSNLIDTVSHEFRTPLTCIKGYTSRLLRNDLNVDEETKIKSLKVIKQQTERLGRLVDDLLVVPEIESDFIRLFPSEIDLKEVIENCILYSQHKQQRKITLEIPDELPFVWADHDRTVQVIINLLENAIKYSPENSPINIDVALLNDDFAEVKIKNQSPPIEKEKLNSLFDKFTRIDDNLTRTTRGTGLGLFIVKGLINAMQGEIFAFADDCFVISFTLPVCK